MYRTTFRVDRSFSDENCERTDWGYFPDWQTQTKTC